MSILKLECAVQYIWWTHALRVIINSNGSKTWWQSTSGTHCYTTFSTSISVYITIAITICAKNSMHSHAIKIVHTAKMKGIRWNLRSKTWLTISILAETTNTKWQDIIIWPWGLQAHWPLPTVHLAKLNQVFTSPLLNSTSICHWWIVYELSWLQSSLWRHVVVSYCIIYQSTRQVKYLPLCSSFTQKMYLLVMIDDDRHEV